MSMFRVFHLAWLTCRATNSSVAGWRKLLRKVRTRVYFEQLTLHPHKVNQPISALHFVNPQQMFLLSHKLITRGEKRETSTQNLQRNNVARQVDGFCISYFAAFKLPINIGSVDRKIVCWNVVMEIKCKCIRWPGFILSRGCFEMVYYFYF